jgi:hypothetical protein
MAAVYNARRSYLCRGGCMERMSTGEPRRGRVGSIFTDIHFWVPAVVLIGGLLMLRIIH